MPEGRPRASEELSVQDLGNEMVGSRQDILVPSGLSLNGGAHALDYHELLADDRRAT